MKMMNNLEVKAFNPKDLPAIDLDYEKGEMKFQGMSRVETVNAYDDVLNWIKQYSDKPKPQTKVVCDFDYFNTATSKVLMDIFQMFDDMYKGGSEVAIEWRHLNSDRDMHDAGKLFSEMVSIPFEFVEEEE